MTTDDFFLRLYEAGCSRGEILSSDLSDLLLRLRADVRRLERGERAAFRATHNAIATSFSDGGENPYEEKRSVSGSSGGDLDGMKYRVQQHTDLDIERDLTTS